MMKILLPTSLLLGFVLSIGANQMSEAAYTQPLLSPPSQGQLIHVRWKTTHDVNAPSLHSVKRAHTHHHRTPSHHARHHIERKHTHHPAVSHHTRHHIERKHAHHPAVSHHTRHHIERKHTHHHHGVRHHR